VDLSCVGEDIPDLELLSTVMLEEKEGNDHNMLSPRDTVGRLRYSLCTFKREVQNIIT